MPIILAPLHLCVDQIPSTVSGKALLAAAAPVVSPDVAPGTPEARAARAAIVDGSQIAQFHTPTAAVRYVTLHPAPWPPKKITASLQAGRPLTPPPLPIGHWSFLGAACFPSAPSPRPEGDFPGPSAPP